MKNLFSEKKNLELEILGEEQNKILKKNIFTNY